MTIQPSTRIHATARNVNRQGIPKRMSLEMSRMDGGKGGGA